MTTGRSLRIGEALLGGGLFANQGFTTFSEATINAATQENHRRQIAELIARDKNHPCVVIWSIANEPESETDAAREYYEAAAPRTTALRHRSAAPISGCTSPRTRNSTPSTITPSVRKRTPAVSATDQCCNRQRMAAGLMSSD